MKSEVKRVDISKLDKKTQNYIKDLEHAIDVQSELIEAQQEIINYQKIQIAQQQEYVQKIHDSVNHLSSLK